MPSAPPANLNNNTKNGRQQGNETTFTTDCNFDYFANETTFDCFGVD